RLNPRLVYAAVSTYGPSGTRREDTGVDLIAQAESGIMSVTGLAEGPALPVGVAIADALGGINLAFSVMSALYGRDRTGRGQLVPDERFRSVGRRLKHRTALLEILEAALRTETVSEWVRRLRAEGVLAAPVRGYQEIAGDADSRADGYIRRLDHPEKGEIETPG